MKIFLSMKYQIYAVQQVRHGQSSVSLYYVTEVLEKSRAGAAGKNDVIGFYGYSIEKR
jgi:hypothetical protein